MRQHRLPEHRPRRSGFTLVELLVAITIFAILSTIAVSAYRGLTDTDRLRNGAQLIQSAINGARSRALNERLPRGVRFKFKNDVVDSVVYIGSLRELRGDGKRGLMLQAYDEWTLFSKGFYYKEFQGINNTGAFRDPLTGKARPLRIYLDQTSRWYRIKDFVDDAANQQFIIKLAEPFPYGVNQLGPGSRLSYRLEVGPTELPGLDPIPLPNNIVIKYAQVRGSVLPITGDVDILFGATGNPIPLGEGGVLRFLLSDLRDAITPDASNPTLDRIAAGTPQYEQRVVTFFGATGQTAVSEAGPAGDYFRYAIDGKEAKQ